MSSIIEAYERGFRDGEKSERELRAAAERLLSLQKIASKQRSKNLHNEARRLVGLWLCGYAETRWRTHTNCTVDGMAKHIAEDWTDVIQLMINEFELHVSQINQELEDELNKQNEDDEVISLKIPQEFDLLRHKILKLTARAYRADSIKRHIRLSKPEHLKPGRPRKNKNI